MALRAVTDHPKFARLKKLLKLPKYAVMGCLETLWHFTGRYTPHGDLGKYSDAEIESWLEWDGEDGALVAALIAAGWVDASPDYRLVVHHWHLHSDDATRLAVKRSGKPFVALAVTTVSPQCPDTVAETATRTRLPEPGPVNTNTLSRKQPRDREKKKTQPADPRTKPFVAAVADYWKKVNPNLKFVWGKAEGRNLKLLFADARDLTVEQFTACLRNRAESEAVIHSERPYVWITNVTKYADGPLNRYQQPVDQSSQTQKLKIPNEPYNRLREIEAARRN